MPQATLIQALAAHAAGIRLATMPQPVQVQGALCILDTLGCMVSGSAMPETRTLLRCEAARDSRREASVVGHAQRLSVEGATRVNGYMGDLLELNDLVGGHASIGIVPPALAVAEARGASGAQLLEAVVAGLEVTARVYYGYYPGLKPFTEVGMSAVGFPSTLGAAAAVARLLALDEQQTAHAMANAAALTGWCPAEVVFGQGGSIKPMLFGACPGVAALAGCDYAAAGLTGPLSLLESPIGFFATAARSVDAAAVHDRETWHVARPRRKLHACCGYIHSAIDTLVALRQGGLAFDRAREIIVRMPAYIIPAVAKAQPPASTTEALFHAQFCLALAISGRDAIAPGDMLRCRELAADAQVADAMRRIRIEEAPELTHYHQSVVRVVGADGTVLAEQARTAPKGSAANPLSDEEVREKFRQLSAGRIAGMNTDAFIARVEHLAAEREVGWVVRGFSVG